MNRHVNEFDQPVGAPLPDWQPRPRPPREPADGRYCRLEPLDPERHAQALFRTYAEARPAAWTYLPYGPFDSLAAFRRWLDADCSGDDPLFHVIVDAAGGRPVGLASYLRIDPRGGVIEVGHIHFGPALQRTPLASEAMYLMMRRAFAELGYRRYEWKCDALNTPSRHAAERLGFQFEGIFRQATVYRKRNRDTAWYSILDHEWPALRRAFERWLGPDNFDAGGRQRERLSALTARVRAELRAAETSP